MINTARRYWIQLTAWEYWPFSLVYVPIFFYWIGLIVRARSFFFFRYANPNIENGGFLMESKWSIYQQLPEDSFPKTIFVKQSSSLQDMLKDVRAATLSFPLIAKPDVGMRGMHVAVIRDVASLARYAQACPVNFLLQHYVDYPLEVGIFYCRMPGEKCGKITGMVQKDMLQVVGDGKSTLRRLIQQHDRAFLHMRLLETALGESLNQIIALDEVKVLVPLGNHARGSLFRDVSDQVDEALTCQIDAICTQIPEFYFGRLDIRFSSWEELRIGQRFSIIELNGAGSEPTHIYDPSHSLLFAWQEIIRHLNLLYRISVLNRRRNLFEGMSFREGWNMIQANKRHVALLQSTRVDVESIGIK